MYGLVQRDSYGTSPHCIRQSFLYSNFGIFHIAPKVVDSFLEITAQAYARLNAVGKF